MRKRPTQKLASEFRRTRGRIFLRSATAVLLAIALAVLANLLSARLYYSGPIKTRLSLSERTENILDQISGDIEIVACFDTSSSTYKPVADLLEMYGKSAEKRSGLNLVVTTLDIRRDAEAVADLDRRYGIPRGDQQPNCIIVRNATTGRVLREDDLYLSNLERGDEGTIDFVGDSRIAYALWNISRLGGDVVYFLTGNGEYKPDDYDSQSGYSTIAKALKQDFYTVRTLDPVQTPTIPADCTLLVVAGPRVNIPSRTIELIGNHLASGGRLLLLMNRLGDEGLEALLRRWGVVAEPPPRPGERPEYRIVSRKSYVTGALVGILPSFGNACVLRVAPEALTSAVDADQPRAEILLAPWRPRAAFGAEEPAPADRAPSEATPSPEEHAAADGTAADAASSSESAPVAPEPAVAVAVERGRADTRPRLQHTRMIVVGDSEFASNSMVDLGGNQAFFLACVQWLTDHEMPVGRTTMTFRKLDTGLSAKRWPYAVAIVVVGWPLALLLFGALIRRR